MRILGLKLTSLLLAIVVWTFVSAPRRGNPIERALSASISLVGMPREYIITSPTSVPDKVMLRLRGRKPDLDALSSRNLEATVELNWIQQKGEASITLRPQAFNVPPEVEVVSIDPNKFRFRVDELRQSAVNIRPFLLGEVPEGYIVGQISVNPDRALISGPATQIVAMEEIGTERIIMTGRTATFTQSVAVVSDSPLVRVISPTVAQVTVPVLAEVGPELPRSEAGTTDEEATTNEEARRESPQ